MSSRGITSTMFETQALSIQTLGEYEWTVLANGILAWALLQPKRVSQKEMSAHMNTNEKAEIPAQLLLQQMLKLTLTEQPWGQYCTQDFLLQELPALGSFAVRLRGIERERAMCRRENSSCGCFPFPPFLPHNSFTVRNNNKLQDCIHVDPQVQFLPISTPQWKDPFLRHI